MEEQKQIKTTKRTVFVGKVVSDKMEKTVVVEIERMCMHKQYQKVVRRIKTYKVHDEEGLAQVGDIVEIFEGRPISKTKYMYLSKIIKSHTA